jgi:membrane associated rhomboid family serine protease
MRYNTRIRYSSSLNWSFPPGIKWLIAANCAVFLLDFLISMAAGRVVSAPFALVPRDVLHGYIWQLGTYMFLHELSFPFLHLILNMLALWMFGQAVEQTWGTNRFLRFYFICGVGAAACVVLVNLLLVHDNRPVIGASGAIYGVLLAFGMLFPDQTVLMGMFFPIKAKYMVMIYGGMALIGSMQTQGTVSSLAHLGGMVFGYIYIRTMFGRRLGFSLDLDRRWKEFRLQRAKKKFQVYMKKQDSNRGPWVN